MRNRRKKARRALAERLAHHSRKESAVTMTEIPAHVYHRIAEDVQRKTGLSTDSLEVNAFIHDDWSGIPLDERARRVQEATIIAAREYGIEVSS